MNWKNGAYWATTGLVAFAMASGGLMDLARPEELTRNMAALGYPAYFMTILGTWKVLGAVAVLAPRTARLKEWAYAGIVFDLSGAALSHAFVGDAAGKVLTPVFLLGLAMASWALRPASRRLGGAAHGDATGAIAPAQVVTAAG